MNYWVIYVYDDLKQLIVFFNHLNLQMQFTTAIMNFQLLKYFTNKMYIFKSLTILNRSISKILF